MWHPRSNKYRGIQNFNEMTMKPKINVKFAKKFAHLLCCIRSLQTELFTVFEKFPKPRSFESKTLKEVERAKIQLLHYISIFHFATLGTPANAIYHKKFYFRATAFLQKRPEVTSDLRLGVIGRKIIGDSDTRIPWVPLYLLILCFEAIRMLTLVPFLVF